LLAGFRIPNGRAGYRKIFSRLIWINAESCRHVILSLSLCSSGRVSP
jgi:hypothetical protein